MDKKKHKSIRYYFCAVEQHNDRVEAGYTNEQGTQWCDYSDVKFFNHTKWNDSCHGQ